MADVQAELRKVARQIRGAVVGMDLNYGDGTYYALLVAPSVGTLVDYEIELKSDAQRFPNAHGCARDRIREVCTDL